MLLSRFRTLEEYGTYSQIMIVITLFTSIILMGLPNSTNYFLARAETPEQRRYFLSIYYTLNTFLCMVMGIVLFACIPIFENYFSNTLIGEYWYFLAFYPWAFVTITSISNVLVVYGKTEKLVAVNIINALVSLLSILVVQYLGFAFREYMILFLCGSLALCIYLYILVFKLEKGIAPKIDWDYIKKIFIYSIPLGLATVVGTINIEVDKLMIGKLMDTESLAIYTNASKELPLTMISASLTAVILPQMAKRIKSNDYKTAVSLWGNSFELSIIFMAFFAMACVAFAPQLMTFLYSEKYLPGVSVFVVYAFVLLTRTTYWGMALSALGKTKLILWCSIGSLVLNVILNYVLYKALGIVGPAIASFVSIFLMLVLQISVSAKLMNTKLADFFPWKNVLLIILLNTALGVVSYFATRLIGLGVTAHDIFIAILLGLAIAVIYALIMRKRLMELWRILNAEKM